MGTFLIIAGIVGAIAAAIALGKLIAYICVLTYKWIKNKITEKLNEKNVKKVAACTLEKLIDECPHEITLQDLQNKGYTHAMASVDNNGKVSEVAVIKNTGDDDAEVDELLGEGDMVVVKQNQ